MPKLSKQDAQRLLANVPLGYVFRVHDGGVLANMIELRDGLDNMQDEIFSYHVYAEKNDFFNWVRDIIKDDKLANDLLKASGRKAAASKVRDRIVTLKKAAGQVS